LPAWLSSFLLGFAIARLQNSTVAYLDGSPIDSRGRSPQPDHRSGSP
jgi:hypothetical protein